MFRWLKKAAPLPPPPEPSLHDRLERITEGAANALPHARGALLARAGDLCVGAGETHAAKSYYGRAIDAYLEARSYSEAAATCDRLIKAAPDVVRAYFTLLVLAIREGNPGEIQGRVTKYVEVSKRSRTENYAIARLWMVANLISGQELLRAVGRGLVELGDTQGGESLLARAATTPEPGPDGPHARHIENVGCDQLMKAAMASPVAVWARHWMGLDMAGATAPHPRMPQERGTMPT